MQSECAMDQNGRHINTRFINCLYCKIDVTNVVLIYFLEYSKIFSANYQPASDVASSNVLYFHANKTGIMPMVTIRS